MSQRGWLTWWFRSAGLSRFECMFDSEFAAATDSELIAAIENGVRQEAMGGAWRLAAIAELTRRRVDDDDDRTMWAFDAWDSAVAEVAGALKVGHRRASGQMRIARALRERLPKVATLYWKGSLVTRLISTITWCTHLVEDEKALARIDAAIADRACSWNALSEDKLREAVNVWVARYDPDALRRTQTAARGRDFAVGACDDDNETTSVWGRLLATDAAVLQQRVAAMATGVCDNDPRSIGERRADALGALANGNDTLACACGSPACLAAGETPRSNVVIRVIADQAAIDAATEQPAQPADEKHATSPAPPALLLGRGVLPNSLLAEAIRAGATIKPIRMPSDRSESHYRPSDELAEFVRMRDLSCRFPGCNVAADHCDLDHVRPWPWGPTHASNLNCKCRKHHLMKTFWTGIGGWVDEQLPDGTVIWTTPSGATYTTQPGSRLLFPNWDVTTADLPPPEKQPFTSGDRRLKMPRRQRTRAVEESARIKAERALNECDIPPF
jgi:uncharacterized protein DUF222